MAIVTKVNNPPTASHNNIVSPRSIENLHLPVVSEKPESFDNAGSLILRIGFRGTQILRLSMAYLP